MIGIRRGADTACGHHWHPTDAGWECCCCPGRVKPSNRAPEQGNAACRAEFDEPSIIAWLAPEIPAGRARRVAARPRLVTGADERILEHAYDARGAIGRLRRVWPWLGEARLPGKPAAHLLLERRLSADAERVEDEQVRRDRRAKMLALRTGRTPLAPFAAPVRLGPVRARARIALALVTVGGRVHATLPGRLADPTLDAPKRPCRWCAGHGRAQRPDTWEGAWPQLPVTCSMCGGYGKVCAVCGSSGGCYCDLADVVVDACLDAIAQAVGNVADEAVAAAAATGLNAAADLACATLGLREVDMRVIKAPCPACGRRDLWADVASPNRDEWSVICRSELCRCAGPTCGCGRPTRWEGRRHRWPAAEFWALADRLGVRVQTLLAPTGRADR